MAEWQDKLTDDWQALVADLESYLGRKINREDLRHLEFSESCMHIRGDLFDEMERKYSERRRQSEARIAAHQDGAAK